MEGINENEINMEIDGVDKPAFVANLSKFITLKYF
ncbi:MAG: hypothetical protein Ct9H300mP20_19020 [Gammaproteobacteria bacterium]|nr:MAG: hypothetical protein Ct9H300mP20_19020 [Gammaproteobacteria bacterium]